MTATNFHSSATLRVDDGVLHDDDTGERMREAYLELDLAGRFALLQLAQSLIAKGSGVASTYA